MYDKVRDFVQGNVNYYTSLAPYQQEQVDLRAYLCSACLENSKCLRCGCKTPNMFYAPYKIDKDGKWAEFFNEVQWQALKDNIEGYKIFIDKLNNGTTGELLQLSGEQDSIQRGEGKEDTV